VPYYSQYTGPSVFDAAGTTVPAPYGSFNVENRTAMGGWLSSAVDHVKFTQIFDLTTSVLTKSSVDAMFAKPETGLNSGGSYYGFGWFVRDVTGGQNTWHDGSLAGTTTIVTRRYDGITWAVLHDVANATTTWPTIDLFDQYY
jgi:hypothetical protein